MPIHRLTISPASKEGMEKNLRVSFECDFSNEQLQDFMIIKKGVKEELGKIYSEHFEKALDALTLRDSSTDTIIVEREASLKLRHLPELVTIGLQEADFTTYVFGQTSDLYTCSAYQGKYKTKVSYPKSHAKILETNFTNPVQVLLDIAKHELQTLKNDS